MTAFKTASNGHKSRTGLLIAVLSLFFVGLLAGGAWIMLNRLAAQREKATTEEAALHAQAMQKAHERAVQEVKDMQAREAELTRQKLAAEESARKAESEKHAFEEQVRLQEVERQKALNEATAKRVAEERRLRQENERVLEQANREKEELRKKIEDAQRIAREKLKKQQDDEAAKAAILDPPKTETVKSDVPKAEGPKPEAVKPIASNTPKNDAALNGAVKTIPSDPAVVPDKLDLPSGGVRLFVKASDPYAGKLTFQWRQLKGAQVEIADPAAAKFIDGKWISQTYFVARQPGNYEFEVSVKNDDGVESKKKFPIEVLPPTTLK